MCYYEKLSWMLLELVFKGVAYTYKKFTWVGQTTKFFFKNLYISVRILNWLPSTYVLTLQCISHVKKNVFIGVVSNFQIVSL